jgi:hypothetical protein
MNTSKPVRVAWPKGWGVDSGPLKDDCDHLTEKQRWRIVQADTRVWPKVSTHTLGQAPLRVSVSGSARPMQQESKQFICVASRVCSQCVTQSLQANPIKDIGLQHGVQGSKARRGRAVQCLWNV